MAALVQSYPQQSSSVTMLQTRPPPTSGMLPPGPSQANQQYMGPAHTQRHSFHGMPGGKVGQSMYRGNPGHIQPYAFTSTPNLNTNMQWQQFSGYRASSSPSVPTMQMFDQGHGSARARHGASASMNNLPYNPLMGLSKSGSRDDSSIRQPRTVTTAPRPQSAYMSGSSTQLSFAHAAPVRASPDRYRRSSGGHQQRPQNFAPPSGSGKSSASHPHSMNEQRRNPSRLPAERPRSFYGSVRNASADDIQLYRQASPEESRRLRRRSMHTLDSADYPKPLAPQEFSSRGEPSRLESAATAKNPDKDQKSVRLVSNGGPSESTMHLRNASSESVASTRSSNSRPSRPSSSRNVATPTDNPSATSSIADDKSEKQDQPKLVNVPPRGSPSDVSKRSISPSPLSLPATMASDAAPEYSPSSLGDSLESPRQPAASNDNIDSPAARQLAAISQQGAKLKSKTSRLRRAFSFGSTADFKKAAGQDQAAENDEKNEPSRLQKQPTADELYKSEQARIAQKQEEGGIGNSIYGAKFFSRSTDNLSISSTASSASVMIRKMSRGVKRSTRSLVGLFRPKSMLGAPAADALAPETTPAAVSVVTVEAERERVNVNPDPHTQPGGGTGFPHLERNSIETSKTPSVASERLGSSDTDNSNSRKSIVGGDRERAEVLAAVRKGILKNTSGSSSPPRDHKEAAFDLPGVPAIAGSPNSSAPSTPTDENQGHKRSDSVAIGNEDYFMTALRLRQDNQSAPGTPRGTKRSATFSPRIVFYDTWPSQEYDRWGEIATCNRLTPMLAQQIKEELNTFKMEMEVHENSKIYTHFF